MMQPFLGYRNEFKKIKPFRTKRKQSHVHEHYMDFVGLQES